MKAVAFSVESSEKEFLAKANNKKHDITLISNALSIGTVIYAKGKAAIIVSITDNVSDKIIRILSGYGVKYIAARSVETDHIDKVEAAKYNIKVASINVGLAEAIGDAFAVPADRALLVNEKLQQNANQTILSLDIWQQCDHQEKSLPSKAFNK
ncbi:MAG: hydroxyacid dehydrogenase [Mucilaginibacter sp.]|nr:hydroxyacid dehydrogenase [Mucilaginibacter sp.]